MLLVNPLYEGVSQEWFNPAYWEGNAVPITSGGRGSAWFVSSRQGEFVLRHYRRGGLVGRILRKHYLFTGYSGVRSFAEFRLLSELHEEGLPVPRPVSACCRRVGLCYTAAIIIERIEPAVTFGSVWRDTVPQDWVRIGSTIRQFHDANVFHADLNCFNILLKPSQVYLIDFDKCKRRVAGARSESWKRANLDRLHRSLERELVGSADKERLLSLWPSLEDGYHHR